MDRWKSLQQLRFMTKNILLIIAFIALSTFSAPLSSFAQNCRVKLSKVYDVKLSIVDGDLLEGKIKIAHRVNRKKYLINVINDDGTFYSGQDIYLALNCRDVYFDFPTPRHVVLVNNTGQTLIEYEDVFFYECNGSLKGNRIINGTCSGTLYIPEAKKSLEEQGPFTAKPTKQIIN